MNRADTNGYRALTTLAGYCRLADQTLLELTGPDRATFLHNFCTADVRRLQSGQGCEAFITSVRGKILGHVRIASLDGSLMLDTVPHQAEKLLAHLDHYLIREDVQLHDRTPEQQELVLLGPRAAEVLQAAAAEVPPAEPLACAPARVGDLEVVIQRLPRCFGLGFAIRTPAAQFDQLVSALEQAGAVAGTDADWQTVRIETGWPLYGHDIDEDNLPQEIGRDGQAISFTKGCYLGQETVARIDALGHVNRRLCLLLGQNETVPTVGAKLFSGGKEVGHVTSATWSPKFSAPLALGYLRRGLDAPGDRVECDGGALVVVAQPREAAPKPD